MPPDLITYSKDAAALLADLQSRNERMFLLTFTVVNIAPTRQKLENDVFTISGIAQKYNCALKRLDWQQEQGFTSSLVLGGNAIEIQRGMTTSSTAIFIPFMTKELRMDGAALYYGMNENVGTEGAHHSELVGEAVGRWGTRRVRQAVRDHPAKAAARAESRYVKATAEHRFQTELEKHPDLGKNALARFAQKQRQKRQYAKQAREAARQGARAAEKTAVSAEKLAEKVAGFVKRHPGGVVITLACLLLLFTVQSCASSLVTLGNGIIGGIGASTYPAQDGDMLGAEAAYCALEAELQHYLDTYTSTHDYDEYHFDLDDIEHDPYVVISMLSALHEGEWTLEEVRGTLQTIFDRQYILTENVVTERRYYIETDTWTDSEGNTHTSSYRVYYDYYICTVTLKNEDLSHLPIYIMSGEQLSRYALYMAALGNRPDLFPNSGYVDKYITHTPKPYGLKLQPSTVKCRASALGSSG